MKKALNDFRNEEECLVYKCVKDRSKLPRPEICFHRVTSITRLSLIFPSYKYHESFCFAKYLKVTVSMLSTLTTNRLSLKKMLCKTKWCLFQMNIYNILYRGAYVHFFFFFAFLIAIRDWIIMKVCVINGIT